MCILDSWTLFILMWNCRLFFVNKLRYNLAVWKSDIPHWNDRKNLEILLKKKSMDEEAVNATDSLGKNSESEIAKCTRMWSAARYASLVGSSS